MEFIHLLISNSGIYRYNDASNIEMTILGHFLATDAGSRPSSFREWFFDDSTPEASSNLTALVRENGYVFLSDLYSEEEDPTELKMTYAQFLKVLDGWEEKIIKLQSKEVIMTTMNLSSKQRIRTKKKNMRQIK